MIKIYQKQPIQAEQFDGSQKMIDEYDIIPAYDKNSENKYWQPVFPCSILMTKEGALSINVGDWIATGVNGNHWPIADDVFRKTYAKLPVIPKCVADWIEECKQEYKALSDMLCSESRPEQVCDWMAFIPGTHQFDYARYQKCQELVARAWLDGYQVEAEHDTRTD